MSSQRFVAESDLDTAKKRLPKGHKFRFVVQVRRGFYFYTQLDAATAAAADIEGAKAPEPL